MRERTGGLGAHGADRAAEGGGDLFVGQVVDVPQEDDGPLPGAEGGERGRELGAVLDTAGGTASGTAVSRSRRASRPALRIPARWALTSTRTT